MELGKSFADLNWEGAVGNSLPSASVKPVNLEKTWKQKKDY